MLHCFSLSQLLVCAVTSRVLKTFHRMSERCEIFPCQGTAHMIPETECWVWSSFPLAASLSELHKQLFSLMLILLLCRTCRYTVGSILEEGKLGSKG